MAHVRIQDILVPARLGRYGVPCVSGWNHEMVLGHIAAAEELNSPIIIAFTPQIVPKIPVELGIPLIVNAARRARVPVASILDHGPDFDTVLRAIHSGVSSVMFDGSHLPYDENVRETCEIVRIARSCGVSVEAELGSIGGSEDGSNGGSPVYTDPGQVEDFVKRTQIDALAVSFGNTHGPYKGEPRLDLERVRVIRSRVSIPIVMHGASGLQPDDYRNVIASGISKINYYFAMGNRVARILAQETSANGENAVFHEIINRTIDLFHFETRKLLQLFGCAGKAAQTPVAASGGV